MWPYHPILPYNSFLYVFFQEIIEAAATAEPIPPPQAPLLHWYPALSPPTPRKKEK